MSPLMDLIHLSKKTKTKTKKKSLKVVSNTLTIGL